MLWGPYRDPVEARHCLTAYADAVFHRPVGVLFSTPGHDVWLRQPVFDSAGHGLSLLVRCDQVAHPQPISLPSMQKIEDVLAAGGRSALNAAPGFIQMTTGITPQMLGLAGEYVVKPIDGWLNRHPAMKEGIIVVADVAGVIAGGVALFTIATVGGTGFVLAGLVATVVAGAACLVLLAEDGAHFWFVASGDKAGRVNLEHSAHYQWIEAIMPWLTLPDLVLGGRGVFREAAEASERAANASSRAALTRTKASQMRREFRETLSDPDQSWSNISRARAQAN